MKNNKFVLSLMAVGSIASFQASAFFGAGSDDMSELKFAWCKGLNLMSIVRLKLWLIM